LGLKAEVGEPLRHQVTEMPPVIAEVTEFQMHSQWCPCCEHATQAELPPGVPTTCVGPRLQGITAVLTGLYKLSKRSAQDLLRNLCKAELSLGSVTACEQRTSEVLAAPVAEAHEYVQDQPVLNADETGWREARKRAWLWVAVTGLVTVFMIHGRRGGVAANKLLGRFAGILGTDRWCAYAGHLLRKRQVCWAHLRRHWTFFVDRGGKAKDIGEALLVQTGRMFEWWHRVRDGTMARSTFQAKMAAVRAEVERLLAQGLTCGHRKVEGMCHEILMMSPALWTFVRVEGVEPTNNGSERALRPAVQYRKTSFGTHSEDGSRFLERMLTVAATLKQQDRNVFDYMTEAGERALHGLRPRSILPGGHVMSPKALSAAKRALATT
jgi:transposase